MGSCKPEGAHSGVHSGRGISNSGGQHGLGGEGRLGQARGKGRDLENGLGMRGSRDSNANRILSEKQPVFFYFRQYSLEISRATTDGSFHSLTPADSSPKGKEGSSAVWRWLGEPQPLLVYFPPGSECRCTA